MIINVRFVRQTHRKVRSMDKKAIRETFYYSDGERGGECVNCGSPRFAPRKLESACGVIASLFIWGVIFTCYASMAAYPGIGQFLAVLFASILTAILLGHIFAAPLARRACGYLGIFLCCCGCSKR